MSAFLVIVGDEDEATARSIISREEERAPHGTNVWTGDNVTFAHAALTDGPPERSLQFLIRGPLTVVADARIDDENAVSDAAAILDAYERWGSDCAAHLTGDFAFVVYDASFRTIHAARDFLGIRPLFYATIGSVFVVGSSINMIRAHPQFREELREAAIARYLAGSYSEVPEETFYRGLRRVRPGHTLTFANGEISTRRYWTIDTAKATRFRHHDDYVHHFLEVFDRATRDRLRGGFAAIMMSGGLDSTSVAATARFVCPSIRIDAYTTNFSALFLDDEATFAATAARALKLEHHVYERDQDRLFSDPSTYRRAEPFEDPLADVFLSISRDAATRSRVMLGGLGGDTLFRTSNDYFRDLVRRGRFIRISGEVLSYVVRMHKLPPLALRSWVKEAFGQPPWKPEFPSWLRPEVVQRFGLLDEFEDSLVPQRDHPCRPEAAAYVFSPFWARYFETWDPGETRLPIDMTHPILDKRVVETLLSYPPMPWFGDKYLMRNAMKGRLPDAIRLRSKSVLAGDPLRIAAQADVDQIDDLLSEPVLESYVDRSALVSLLRRGTSDLRTILPVTFARWWRSRQVPC